MKFGVRWGRALAEAILAVTMLGGCRAVSRHFAGAPVILISVDTLRADHLPEYGYKLVETPHIDAFRKDAILYTNAISQVPLTLPSHTTMMTGLLPPQNGVRDNVGYTLSSTHETLAEALKKDGYATGAAVSAVVLTSNTGIAQGFDDYDDRIEARTETASLGQVQRSGFDTEKIAEGWISAHDSEPFFYFLHLYEPHSPYTPVPPFDKIYKDRPYDGEIATTDEILGNFFAFLKRAGVYQKAAIFFVSDHGEGLGEHGEAEHGVLLYRETLHVPMMVKLPGDADAGATVARPVALVDLFPTITRLVGARAPANLAGRPIPFDAGQARDFPVRDIYSETLYPRYHFGWSDLASLTDDQYEYIHAPRDEFYDFAADPGEKSDLAPGLPGPFRRMRNLLLGMDRPRQAPGQGDPEQVKKLAALGYIGGTAAPENATNLPNPADHMGELDLLQQAVRDYSQARYADAVPVLEKLIRTAPNMPDAWQQLANVYHKLGRTQDAIAALVREDRLKPGDPVTLASMANEYFDLGNMEQARLYALRAIAVNGPVEAHEVLAGVYLRDKNYGGARQEAETALQRGHMGHVKPEMILAQVDRDQGNLQGALARLERVEAELAAEQERQVSNLHYLKGDILARLGRNADAEAQFRDEMRYFPGNPVGWTSLAFLYASEGKSSQARQTLLDMVKASPTPRCFQAASESFGIMGDKSSAAHWASQAKAALSRKVGG